MALLPELWNPSFSVESQTLNRALSHTEHKLTKLSKPEPTLLIRIVGPGLIYFKHSASPNEKLFPL